MVTVTSLDATIARHHDHIGNDSTANLMQSPTTSAVVPQVNPISDFFARTWLRYDVQILLVTLACFFTGHFITWTSYYCISWDNDAAPSDVMLDQSAVPYDKLLFLGLDGLASKIFEEQLLEILEGKEDVEHDMPDNTGQIGHSFIIMDRPWKMQFSAGLWSMISAGQQFTFGLSKGYETLWTNSVGKGNPVKPTDAELAENLEFSFENDADIVHESRFYFGTVPSTIHPLSVALPRWHREAKHNEVLTEGLDRAMNRTRDDGVNSFVYDMRSDSIGHMQRYDYEYDLFVSNIEDLKRAARKLVKFAVENPDTLCVMASDHGAFVQTKTNRAHKPGFRTTTTVSESTVHGRAYIDNAATFAVFGSTANKPWPIPDWTTFAGKTHQELSAPVYNPDYVGNYSIGKVSRHDFTMRHLDAANTLALLLKDFPLMRNSIGIPLGPDVGMDQMKDSDAIKVCENLYQRLERTKDKYPDNPAGRSIFLDTPSSMTCSAAHARSNSVDMSFALEDHWCQRSVWGTKWAFPLIEAVLFSLFMLLCHRTLKARFDMTHRGVALFLFVAVFEMYEVSILGSVGDGEEGDPTWRIQICFSAICLGILGDFVAKLWEIKKTAIANPDNASVADHIVASKRVNLRTVKNLLVDDLFPEVAKQGWGFVLLFWMDFTNRQSIFYVTFMDATSKSFDIALGFLVLMFVNAFLFLVDDKFEIRNTWFKNLVELKGVLVGSKEGAEVTDSKLEKFIALAQKEAVTQEEELGTLVEQFFHACLSLEGLMSVVLTIPTLFLILFYSYSDEPPALGEDDSYHFWKLISIGYPIVFLAVGLVVISFGILKKELLPGMLPALCLHWSAIGSALLPTAVWSTVVAPFTCLIVIQWLRVWAKNNKEGASSCPPFAVFVVMMPYANWLLMNMTALEYGFFMQPWTSQWNIVYVEITTTYRHICADVLSIAMYIIIPDVFARLKEGKGEGGGEKKQSILSFDGVVGFFVIRMCTTFVIWIPAFEQSPWEVSLESQELGVGGLVLAQSGPALTMMQAILILIMVTPLSPILWVCKGAWRGARGGAGEWQERENSGSAIGDAQL